MTTQLLGEERRRYPRAPFSWRAAYGPRDALELVNARTVDVSLGGVCLRGPVLAAPGVELLVLMAMKDRIVPALATVVRSEQLDADEARLQLEFNWFSDFGRVPLIHLTKAGPVL